MNSNYFFPPLAQKFSNKSLENNLQSGSPVPPLNYVQQKSGFLSNPKSDYEDRQLLLKKAYNEELRQAYNSHQQQLDLKRQSKRSSIVVSKSPELTKNSSPSPEYFSPQLKKTENWLWHEKYSNLPEAPWIEDYSLRAKDHETKKKQWIQSLNEQIIQKTQEKNKKIAEKAAKDKEDEARIRRELQELDIKYKKELKFESGSTNDPYIDDSLAQVSSIIPVKPITSKKSIFKDPYFTNSPTIPEHPKISSNKSGKLIIQQRLNNLRTEVNSMIKDLKTEAQASKYEKDEVLQDFKYAMSLLHESNSINPSKNQSIFRTGQTILSRPNPYFYRPMNIY